MRAADGTAIPSGHRGRPEQGERQRTGTTQGNLVKEGEQETATARRWLVRAFNKFNNDWTMNLVAMVSYNVLTSFFPLVLALITILAFIPAASGSTAAFADQINRVLPNQVRQNIDIASLIKAVNSASGILSLVSVVGLLWGGSNLFGSIESAFAVIFRVKTRDFLPQKLMELLMILLFVLLLPLSFISTLLLGLTTTTLGKIVPGALNGPVVQILGYLGSFGALFVLFAAIYIVVPNIPMSWRHAWRGSLIAAVAMWVINTVFPFYTAHFVGTAQYGQAAIGTAVISITWFWFFSLVLLVGAQVNALAMGIGPWKYDLTRSLMEYPIPTTEGQPTAVEALRNEHVPAESDRKVGLSRDVQKVEDPGAGPTRPGEGKPTGRARQQAPGQDQEQARDPESGTTASAAEQGRHPEPGSTPPPVKQMSSSYLVATGPAPGGVRMVPETAALGVTPENRGGFLIIGAVVGMLGAVLNRLRRRAR